MDRMNSDMMEFQIDYQYFVISWLHYYYYYYYLLTR